MHFVETTLDTPAFNGVTSPFYSDEYAVIDLDDSVPCVRVTLNGVPRYSEHYNHVQAKRVELIRREIKNYTKLHLLTDSRTAGPVLDEDIEHFRTKVLPEIERLGVRFLAIVMPSSKFTQLAIREMTEKAQLLNVRYFDSMREARLWLRKQTNA